MLILTNSKLSFETQHFSKGHIAEGEAHDAPSETYRPGNLRCHLNLNSNRKTMKSVDTAHCQVWNCNAASQMVFSEQF